MIRWWFGCVLASLNLKGEDDYWNFETEYLGTQDIDKLRYGEMFNDDSFSCE